MLQMADVADRRSQMSQIAGATLPEQRSNVVRIAARANRVIPRNCLQGRPPAAERRPLQQGRSATQARGIGPETRDEKAINK
jgi:hypothetical protein